MKARITTMNKIFAVLAGLLFMAQYAIAGTTLYTNTYSANGIILNSVQKSVDGVAGNEWKTYDVSGRLTTIKQVQGDNWITRSFTYNSFGEYASQTITQNSTGTDGKTGVKTTTVLFSNHGATVETYVMDTSLGQTAKALVSKEIYNANGGSTCYNYGSNGSVISTENKESSGLVWQEVKP